MFGQKLNIGDLAPEFSLPGVDGKTYSLESFAEKQVLVVVFSCNHCPYVKAYEDRMIKLQADYADKGVALVAICSNDAAKYPLDSFDNMVKRAREKGYNFPYLRDETQEIARAYGAGFTPEFFVFDRERRLAYHGRMDDNVDDPENVTRHYLREAIDALLAGRPVEQAEVFPVGCTIKWK